MSREVHELYKELSQAQNELSRDLVKGLVSLRSMASANKADQRRIEDRMDRVFEELRGKIEALQQAGTALQAKVDTMQKHARDQHELAVEETKGHRAIQVESTRGRFLLWVAIAGGAFSLANLIVKIVATAAGVDGG